MCDIVGIRSEIVAGYTKSKPYQIGTSFSVDHAWNAVLLDSSYYFLDATWAAGQCVEDEETGKLTKFVKEYDDYYWLTPFDKLKRNHFPENAKWVFESNATKEKFANTPYYAGYILSKIDLILPATGIVTAKKGDTIHFKFNYEGDIRRMQINSNIYRNPAIYSLKKISKRKTILLTDTAALTKQKYVPVERNGNIYEFDYVITDSSLYYLEVLFNLQTVMRFKVKVQVGEG